MTRKKAIFNWSGGKDSALALHKIIEENKYEVISLFTTLNEETQKSSMHSIPLAILRKQAESLGIPLHTTTFSKELKNYDEKMAEVVTHFKKQDVSSFIFGDIFLSDVKAYRESKLNPLGIEVIEPLWDKTSNQIMNEFLLSGIKTKIIVTDASKLDSKYIGKIINQDFVKSYPEGLDICGENGEYHSLAYDGPLFKAKVDFKISGITKISHDFKLDTGETKTFYYWQAELSE
ncbi:diphthine--ammonia ligase [Flavobacterium ardleyense]|uniref:Diphthine--ammonia ligase n=1 Tax=Flavobacterium ardleyense TaxID=2038737 RepID=A0ABW5Z8P3_9FLAO